MKSLKKCYGNRVLKGKVVGLSNLEMQALETLRDSLMDKYDCAIIFTRTDVVTISLPMEMTADGPSYTKDVYVEACFWYLVRGKAADSSQKVAPKVVAKLTFRTLGGSGRACCWKPLAVEVHLENTLLPDNKTCCYVVVAPETTVTSIFNKFAPAEIIIPRL